MPSPELPAWFTPGDPWLSEKMRRSAEIADAERQLGPAVQQAVALFLQAAHARLVRLLPGTTLLSAAGLDNWPERDTVWRSAVEKLVAALDEYFSRQKVR